MPTPFSALDGLIADVAAIQDPQLRFLAAVGLTACLPQQADDPGYAFDQDAQLDDVHWDEADIAPLHVGGVVIETESWPRLEFLSFVEDVCRLSDIAERRAGLEAVAAQILGTDVYVAW